MKRSNSLRAGRLALLAALGVAALAPATALADTVDLSLTKADNPDPAIVSV